MEGSLLYHMAMISKMSAESRVVLEELDVEAPSVDQDLQRFYGDFVSDAKEVLNGIIDVDDGILGSVDVLALGVEEKIGLFKRLSEETKRVEKLIDCKDSGANDLLEGLFREWTKYVVVMRLRQEYETINGFLVVEKLAEELGVDRVSEAMRCVRKKFGDETVESAFNVSLHTKREAAEADA